MLEASSISSKHQQHPPERKHDYAQAPSYTHLHMTESLKNCLSALEYSTLVIQRGDVLSLTV